MYIDKTLNKSVRLGIWFNEAFFYPLYFPGICSQPLDTGAGSEAIEKFYYDANTDTCSQFIYKGTQGNENRFAKKGKCELTCRPFTEEGNQALRSTYKIGIRMLTAFWRVRYDLWGSGNVEKVPVYFSNDNVDQC